MKLSKNGFNLGEMLICIGLIAVVTAMMIPATLSRKPAKNKALFRKAYYNTEKVVYDLANDEDKKTGFPETKTTQFAVGKDQSTGFGYFRDTGDGDTVQVKIPKGGSYDTTTRTKALTGKYLCSQIAARMNTSGIVDCNNNHIMPADGTTMANNAVTQGAAGSSPNFVTNDGVAWFISLGQICVSNRAGCGAGTDTWVEVKVDVNGNNPPNSTAGLDPDRFAFSFDPFGKMRVDTDKGKEHLKSNTIYK